VIQQVQQLCRDWLTSGKVGAILSIKSENGNVAPYLFTKPEEIDALVISPKYPVNYMCRPIKKNIFMIIQEKYPELKLGVVAKGCDERALIELAKRELVKMQNLEIIGITCDKKQAEECRCPKPYPNQPIFGEKVEGISEDKATENLLKKDLTERLEFWRYQFSKCIKCYGCRNICPLCFCKECAMEQEWLVKTGTIPPKFPMFHFIRFYHLADRCIECGGCEDSCPMDIPLRTVSKLLRKEVEKLFNYEAGTDVKRESPLITDLEINPMKELSDVL